jgi:hypothetical protein
LYLSSTTKKKSTEDAFSAFADSLEDEPISAVVGGGAEKTKKGKPWQTKLEDLLDPSTNMADRQVLLSELMSSNEDIRDSVMDALTKREVCVCVYVSVCCCFFQSVPFFGKSSWCYTLFVIYLDVGYPVSRACVS